MRRTRLLWAAGPATLGVLAAHQFAYVGHDDGHLHGYLAELGPWLAAASTVASILVWKMPRARFSDVVALQVLLLATMEIGERLVTSSPWAWADLATVGVALASVLVLSTLVLGIARITSLPIRVGHLFGVATCRRAISRSSPRFPASSPRHPAGALRFRLVDLATETNRKE